jgi:carboxyl-terminal processing protease
MCVLKRSQQIACEAVVRRYRTSAGGRLRALYVLLVVVILQACDSSRGPLPDPEAAASPTAQVAGLVPENRSGNASRTPLTSKATETRGQPTSLPGSSPTATPPSSTPQLATPTRRALSSPTAASATSLPAETRLQVFDNVWSTVNEKYLYADFGGIDWPGLRERYDQRVKAVQSDVEFYGVVAEMVAELGDDHSRFLAPVEARSEDAQQRGSADYVGVGIISSPGERSIMVVYVFPGSPADRAGIKRRDRITHVDGIPFQNPRTDPSRIRGAEGTSVRLSITSPGSAAREVVVVRERIVGGVAPSSRRLSTDPAIGYLIIPDLWTGDMDVQVNRELEQLLDARPPMSGLILDLRGNGGGYRSVLEQILGNFVSGEVGQFYDKNGTYQFEVTGRALQQRLAGMSLAVLTDGGTESYAEVLAAALKYRGKAVIVGRPTAGNTETIFRYDFEDGSRLWVAEQGFRLPDGTDLEARGVVPDEQVNEDWTAFTENDDPDILRALDVLARWSLR